MDSSYGIVYKDGLCLQVAIEHALARYSDGHITYNALRMLLMSHHLALTLPTDQIASMLDVEVRPRITESNNPKLTGIAIVDDQKLEELFRGIDVDLVIYSPKTIFMDEEALADNFLKFDYTKSMIIAGIGFDFFDQSAITKHAVIIKGVSGVDGLIVDVYYDDRDQIVNARKFAEAVFQQNLVMEFTPSEK